MSAPHEQLNGAAQRGTVEAARHLDALTRAYARSLRAAGRRAATQFRQTETVTAAANPSSPDWTPPPTGAIIDAAALAADTKRKTSKLHEAMLAAAADETLRPFGLSFDITAPTSQALLDSVGQRIQDGIAAAIEEQIANAIKDGYTNGDSVARVSKAIQAATDAISRPRADMLARTDLNALANGGSLLAATISGAAATKTWLTAEDDLVRDTHAEADGQTVAIDDVFDVGGESAQYPGDPQLSDEESCNCRCTLVYGEPLTASAAMNGHGSTYSDNGTVQVRMPPQLRPFAKVSVAAPDVQVHVRNDMAAPDMEGLERVLGELGPLVAATITDSQRVELARVLEAVLALAARAVPAPEVTVAAADVAAPDLSGIGPAIAAALAPYFDALFTLVRDLASQLAAPRSRRLVVNRAKSGEISNITIEED
jgi:Phage Mu protein F like protein